MYGEKSSMIVQRLPHACGGVSHQIAGPAHPGQSSPRMWGCFALNDVRSAVIVVFPTHVGVFLISGFPSRPTGCLPHACGGVSSRSSRTKPRLWSSPRMWGCFRQGGSRRLPRKVFPTHVGVFLRITHARTASHSLPHACGGVSMCPAPARIGWKSSPRMWGCFYIISSI